MATNRATFLTFLIGSYEQLHEVEEKTPNCQYVLVTDNPSLTSSTWEVKYVDNPHPEDNFDLVLKIRYNPFDYVDSDVVIRCDGSMQPCGDLSRLLDIFEKGNYDTMLTIHPSRACIYDERLAWCQMRGMNVEQANKVLNFIQGCEGYDVKNRKMLFQMNLQISRNNKATNLSNEMTYAFCHYLAEEGKQTDRCDQDIYSFVIGKYFREMKILPVSQHVSTSGTYFKWYGHGSNNQLLDRGEYSQPYLFDNPINTVYCFE